MGTVQNTTTTKIQYNIACVRDWEFLFFYCTGLCIVHLIWMLFDLDLASGNMILFLLVVVVVLCKNNLLQYCVYCSSHCSWFPDSVFLQEGFWD